MSTCTGPGCTRPVKAKGLCVAHYMQDRRGATLTPIREGSQYPAQVVFNLPEELKASAEKAAAREGIDAAEWWRRAGEAQLKNAKRAAKTR